MSNTPFIQEQIQAIRTRLQAEASPEAGKSAVYFIPGIQKQYGVRMPVLNEIANRFKNGGLPLADALWIERSHEEQLLAARIIGKLGRKDPDAVLKRIERYSADINNWAVCDALGMQAIHGIREKYQVELFALAHRLALAESIWQRRLALVLVQWYTRYKHLVPEIETLVAILENDEAYYVQKAISWVKRNLSKKK
ncbi:MAG: DNA alkylation repair protein [Chitinophagaceae bacterium]|nr:DNA alkylation repair protein [Chitinophagaceae bacterium]